MTMLLRGLGLALLVILLDQWSKYAIFQLLDNQPQPFITVTPFFNLVKVYNFGVSFGMLNDLLHGRFILSLIGIGITAGLCVWLYQVTKMHLCLALGLIIGGAIGNIIDRIRIGAVADFLDFYIGTYHWPAFNVADMAVCVGVFIIFIDSFFSPKDKGRSS